MLAQGQIHLVLIHPAGGTGTLFFHLAGDLLDRLDQIGRADRLQQILIHAEGDRFLRVFKLVKSAEDDDLQPGHHRAGMTDQFKTVQERHPDIGQQDIGHQLLHHAEGHFAVRCLATEGIRSGQIFHDPANILPDQQFVFDNKDLDHAAMPPFCFI